MCISLLSVSPSSVLSPTTWPFGLEWLPQSAYLVGGIVRDALLDRQSSQLDLDFVMPEGAVETARTIARHYKAGFVLLDEERQIARVVFDRATADFAQQVGPTLEIDLQRRDFTVNAIAYNPHRGEITDPLKGQIDLKRRLLRMICVENLEEDPLRLLRAYRQAAQLGFSLDPETQLMIQQLAPLLDRVAAERVQAELSYLFSTPKGTPWLIAAWQDGLLQTWFPSTTPHSLKLLAAIESADAVLSERCPALGAELSRWIRERSTHQARSSGSKQTSRENALSKSGSCRRTWLATAKLASFFVAAPDRAESEMVRLKYSRAEIQAVTTILKFLPQLHPEVVLSCREQYFLFQSVENAFPALVLLAVAAGTPLEQVSTLIERFLTPNDPVAHPVPLLTGQDLIRDLGIPPGPQIGRLLIAVQLARAENQITTRLEALEFAQNWLDPEKGLLQPPESST